MNFVASLIVRNELNRYLVPCVSHLLTYVDEVRVLDDRSTDGSAQWLKRLERVYVRENVGRSFDEHEGEARNALLNWTMYGRPTHVLAIDADEFVADGKHLRGQLEALPQCPVWTLLMQEVWQFSEEALFIRRDGGWKPHPAPILYRVDSTSRRWRISNKALACGREPQEVRQRWRRGMPTGTEILHFGWANPDNRQARYDRYMAIDGGNFHNRKHLESIMWPDRLVQLQRRPWPEGLRELVM